MKITQELQDDCTVACLCKVALKFSDFVLNGL